MMQGHDFYSAYLNNHFKIKSRNTAYFLNMSEDDLKSHIDRQYQSLLTKIEELISNDNG